MKIGPIVNNIAKQIVSVSYPADLADKSKQPKTIVLAKKLPRNILNIDIRGLAINSKLVEEGYLFFCLSGTRYKGGDFIDEAYANGARVVMTQDKLKVKTPLLIIRVRDVVHCLGALAGEFYKHPCDRLDMTAVTGTNGKTSITFALENILKTFRKSAGVVGTVNYRFGNNVFPAPNTTPDIITLSSLLKQMADEKVKFLIMEVSSHALAQRRIQGLKFDRAIFTNLSQDHFDYHKTKRNYFLAKSVLFTDYLKPRGTALINIDDAYSHRLISLIKKNKRHGPRIITYGVKGRADISAQDISFDCSGSRFTVQGLKHKFRLETNLIGMFNVYNALASVAVSLVSGIPQEYIVEGLRDVYIPGRLEKVICKQKDIRIFIDYAHTEDGLKNVLSSLNKIKGNAKLIVVFGCGGDRDKGKRPKMGKIATELADFVVITSDNPRWEDPQDIISDIIRGIDKKNYITIADRKEAIKKAIDMAAEKDIVVVAGKGHEDYQIIKDKRLAFNDRLVIEAMLDKLGKKGLALSV